MKRTFVLALVLVVGAFSGCGGQRLSPVQSPLSPPATPFTGRGQLSPDGWIEGDIGMLHVHYVELQIYEPLAWTDIDWDGNRIWLADNVTQRLVGLDRTGEEAESLPFPRVDDIPCNVTGIASSGDRIWIADVSHRQVYALDRHSGEIVTQFPLEGTSQAMDWDGHSLLIAMVEGNHLERRSEAGSLLETFWLNGQWTTGIGWDGSQVWYVDNPEQQVWTLNPVSGQHQQHSSLGVLIHPASFNGLAWADDYLLIFDDMMGRLYAVPREQVNP